MDVPARSTVRFIRAAAVVGVLAVALLLAPVHTVRSQAATPKGLQAANSMGLEAATPKVRRAATPMGPQAAMPKGLQAATPMGLTAAVPALAGPARAVAPLAAPAAAGESISTYDTRIDVRADGTMRVTETIAYDFGNEERHGIVRSIPARFPYDDTRERVYPIDDVTVTMDGSPAEVDRTSEGHNELFRIGDPDETINGRHTYVIAYTVAGALNSFPDHVELYWNVVGHEWPVPIATATASMTGPSAIQRAECFAGPAESRLSCATKSFDASTATFGQTQLAPRAGLTAVVAFPPGTVSGTGPILADRRDLSTAFRATWATVGAGIGVALLGVAAALVLLWRVGRDRRYVGQLPGLTPGFGESDVEERKPLVGAPPVSVEFGPPEKIRPAQAGTLIDERADVLDVTATIIDFAVRRHLHIRELPEAERSGGQDWELTKLTEGDPKFRGYESVLFQALFKDRDKVRLSELKGTFAGDLGNVQRRLYQDLVDQKWYRQSPATTRTQARMIGVGLVVLAGIVTVVLALTTHAALVGLGLIVAAVALLVVAGQFPARTGRGSAMLARVQGFRLYISMAEAEQMKFQEREQIFSEFLPYAIVFGLAERWAAIFAQVGLAPAVGGTASAAGGTGLYWYAGAVGWSMANFDQSIGSFTTSTTGTVATAAVAAAGSSSGHSGFGGGGFSGGGGGGGGGGSW